MTAPASEPSPWHAGERAFHRELGVSERMEEIGPRVLRDHLIDQHREFYPLLPFAVFGTADSAGNPWATLRDGAPGFLTAPDASRLAVRLPRDPSDPADAGFAEGASIALLGIDPATRRRNRLNGMVSETASGFEIAVQQSFGNCPKYIHRRAPHFARPPASPAPAAAEPLRPDDGRIAGRLAVADTLFVASYMDGEGPRQMDVSHRGGRPGFLTSDGDGAFVIPEYAGNRFYNTLGNIRLNGRAGLTVPDFTDGSLLQMTGRAWLDDTPADGLPAGVERFWRFRPERAVLRPEALALRYTLKEWSPFVP